MKVPSKHLTFIGISAATALATYLLIEDDERLKKTENPVFKNAGLPEPLKERLMDQIRIDNGVLVETLSTLQAELQCNERPDPEQVEVLNKQVEGVLNDSYTILEEAERTK